MPRLYLATPVVDDPASLDRKPSAACSPAPTSRPCWCASKPTDQRSMISRIKALAPAIQNTGAALLLDGHVELVARSGADGAH